MNVSSHFLFSTFYYDGCVATKISVRNSGFILNTKINSVHHVHPCPISHPFNDTLKTAFLLCAFMTYLVEVLQTISVPNNNV